MDSKDTKNPTGRRLARRARILELLDQRRQATGDANLGANIEAMLISSELAELEEDIEYSPGALAPSVKKRAKLRRDG